MQSSAHISYEFTHTRLLSSYLFRTLKSARLNSRNSQVSGINRLSAIRFRGGVILQVSCYTLLTRIPTSMATVLLSAPHGTPFRVYRKVEADMVKPCLS